MLVEHIIDELGRVFRKTTYEDGGIIQVFLGLEVKFTISGDQIYYERFETNHYALLETASVPKTVEGEIDYGTIDNRLNYWRSQGSAT